MRHRFLSAAALLFLGSSLLRLNGVEEARELAIVRTACDTLLSHGLDRYGDRHTAMWAAVMDAEGLTVPREGVPPTKGVRPWDQAVGGANLYHETDTLQCMRILSRITGDARYETAVRAYVADALQYTQHPRTGLLGWGEHLYYDFWLDSTTVCAERRDGKGPAYFRLPHEFLAFTPPWELCWEVDPERTARAITGIRWHYQGPDPQVALFNRHAEWDAKAAATEVMPWSKHAALFSYSFAFLQRSAVAAKMKPELDAEHWRRHTGLLYWKLRDRETSLVFSCLYHRTEPDAGKDAGPVATGLYAYWLFKSGQLAGDAEMCRIAVDLFRIVLEQAWIEKEQAFASSLSLDGSPRGRMQAWRAGYSSSAYWELMRIGAYLQRHQPDPGLETAITRLVGVMDRAGDLPDQYTAQNAADAIAAYLDHYDLSGRAASLDRASALADQAIAGLCQHPLPLRQTGDHIYEAKLGCGSLLACLLRLHLRRQGVADPGIWDWSF